MIITVGCVLQGVLAKSFVYGLALRVLINDRGYMRGDMIVMDHYDIRNIESAAAAQEWTTLPK
jgi:hypothetical protein